MNVHCYGSQGVLVYWLVLFNQQSKTPKLPFGIVGKVWHLSYEVTSNDDNVNRIIG